MASLSLLLNSLLVMFGRRTENTRQLVMTEEEFLHQFDLNPEDPDLSWEEVVSEDWFGHLVEQRKDVVRTILYLSDGEALVFSTLKDSWVSKDKQLVMYAMTLYDQLWGNDTGFDRVTLWDFPDISLHKDPEIRSFIGLDSPWL